MHFSRPLFPQLTLRRLTTLSVTTVSPKFSRATVVRMIEHVNRLVRKDLRKCHTVPKLIFGKLKVVVCNHHELYTISRTCNRQLNRYPRPIFSTSADAKWSRMSSPPLVYVIRRRTGRVPKCTLYSHPPSVRCEDDLFMTYGLQNVIFSSLGTQFKVVPT